MAALCPYGSFWRYYSTIPKNLPRFFLGSSRGAQNFSENFPQIILTAKGILLGDMGRGLAETLVVLGGGRARFFVSCLLGLVVELVY